MCAHFTGQAIVASSVAQNVREWLLAVGTLALAVVTVLLWLSTRRMAAKTGEAAQQAAAAAAAARDSTEVARQALALESERWQQELADRIQVHARLVEAHLAYDTGTGNAHVECWNRGAQSISRLSFHIKIGTDPWFAFESTGVVVPGDRALSRTFVVDRVENPTLAAVEATVRAAVVFVDADGRRWVRWTDDWLEAYDGNIVRITGRWSGNAAPT